MWGPGKWGHTFAFCGDCKMVRKGLWGGLWGPGLWSVVEVVTVSKSVSWRADTRLDGVDGSVQDPPFATSPTRFQTVDRTRRRFRRSSPATDSRWSFSVTLVRLCEESSGTAMPAWMNVPRRRCRPERVGYASQVVAVSRIIDGGGTVGQVGNDVFGISSSIQRPELSQAPIHQEPESRITAQLFPARSCEIRDVTAASGSGQRGHTFDVRFLEVKEVVQASAVVVFLLLRNALLVVGTISAFGLARIPLKRP
jgi:hypothetical protein